MEPILPEELTRRDNLVKQFGRCQEVDVMRIPRFAGLGAATVFGATVILGAGVSPASAGGATHNEFSIVRLR